MNEPTGIHLLETRLAATLVNIESNSGKVEIECFWYIMRSHFTFLPLSFLNWLSLYRLNSMDSTWKEFMHSARVTTQRSLNTTDTCMRSHFPVDSLKIKTITKNSHMRRRDCNLSLKCLSNEKFAIVIMASLERSFKMTV